MRVINDYTCAAGHTYEYFLDNTQEQTTCIECGLVARKRQRAISFSLEGVSGSFPGAAMKWDKKRKSKMAQERAQGKTPFGEPDL